jgi:hypothetical protein
LQAPVLPHPKLIENNNNNFSKSIFFPQALSSGSFHPVILLTFGGALGYLGLTEGDI